MLLRDYLTDLSDSLYRRTRDAGLLPQIEYQGIPITIENEAGSVREGVDPDGHAWKTKFTVPYGFINGTWGLDNEEVDCFVGPVEDARMVYIIRQRIQGKPDEDKCMLGFKAARHAAEAYLKHVDNPEMLGNVIEIPIDEFKKIVCNLQEDK